MKYYHLTKSELSPGTVLEPRYGNVIQDIRFYRFSDENYASYLKEMIFENIRISQFPSEPSRLKSNYLIDDLRLAPFFKTLLSKNKIYEVEISSNAKFLRVDMNWMDLSSRVSISELERIVKSYYSGQPTDKKIWEILCEGEVRILKEVTL